MAEPGRARAEASRAQTWPERGARPDAAAWPAPFARFLERAAERLRDWTLAELGPGRLVPWLPVAFGIGIAIYFTASREPAWWAACAVAGLGLVLTVVLRNRPVAFPVALGLAMVALGFAVATLRTLWIAHPVLLFPVGNAELSGFVELREQRERSDRIVIRVHAMEARRLEAPLERVRLSVKKGTAPAVGSFVELKARLNPPLSQLRPGGYDFARDLYFQRIGASGFVLGQIKLKDPPVAAGGWLNVAITMERLRDTIDARIRALIPGDAGAIASALITGKRDAISASVNEAMYVSSLAHILSISGYHMVLVSGVVFFVVRALLALFPALAIGYPIKKWAAVAALAAATFYLLLSGAEVATRRAYIMVAVVLIGMMLDRQALTLRTLTVAALAVLALAPETLVHPSFQMSFAATLALIAGYTRGLSWSAGGADTSMGVRVAMWGGREILAAVLVSLVAGLATTPYAAYHFHRIAPFGVIANLLAMPLVSLWIMPMGLFALLLMPFGLDGLLWQLMGHGIDWMTQIALWVAALPGAVGRVTAFGVGPLLLGTLGLIVLCLLRSPLRLVGAPLALVAVLWAVRTPQPDVLVSADGQSAAVRVDGKLAIWRGGSDTFAARDWLAADADARAVTDAGVKEGISCDPAGCIGTLADGRRVSVVLTPEAFEEDCAKAVVVLTNRQAPPFCKALVIDRNSRRGTGAVALMRDGEGFTVTPARPPGYDRPWAPRGTNPGSAASPTVSTAEPRSSSTPRDATPAAADLEE